MKQELIWDYFQNENPESFLAAFPRLKYLVKMCKKVNVGNRILNIGVGNGVFETIANSSAFDVHSLDPNELAIDNLKTKLKMDKKAKVGYSQNIPFEDSYFDIVVVSEVLEHLDDSVLRKSLDEIRRVLKLGGCIIGTVPAYEDLSVNVVVCPDCGKRFHRWGHLQSFDSDKLNNLLSEKFLVKKIVARHFPYYKSAKILSKIKLFLKDICWRFNIRTADEMFLFLGMK